MTVEETDPVGATLGELGARAGGYVRVAVTVAARWAEETAARRAEGLRAAEAAGVAAARTARAQLVSEAAAARTGLELSGVRRASWWKDATPEAAAQAWATAASYGPVDPELAGIASWLDAEIRGRFGVDPGELWARAERDAAGRAAAAARDAAERGRRAAWDAYDRGDGPRPEGPRPGGEREEGLAAVLLLADADRADRHATAEAAADPTPGREPGDRSLWAAWDLPDRRRALADRLHAAGVGEQAAEARLLADVAQATPPAAAAARADTPPVGERAGRGAGRAPRRAGDDRRPRPSR